MADFEKAIPGVLKWEGKWVDDPADLGGATNMGIIFKVFKLYASEIGLPPTKEALKTLTEEQAKIIYKRQFWDKMRGDEINDQQVANIIFDGFVNAGTSTLKIAQKEAATEADGVFGPHTIARINASNGKILFEGIKDARIRYYYMIAERREQNKKFLAGWLNRINSFKYIVK